MRCSTTACPISSGRVFLRNTIAGIFGPIFNENYYTPGLGHSSQFQNNHSTEMCSCFEADSYLRLIDSCITQFKAQGPSRTCNESGRFLMSEAPLYGNGPFEQLEDEILLFQPVELAQRLRHLKVDSSQLSES